MQVAGDEFDIFGHTFDENSWYTTITNSSADGREAEFGVSFLIFFLLAVVMFCLAAVVFPMGFHIEEIGGEPYQLPSSFQVRNNKVP